MGLSASFSRADVLLASVLDKAFGLWELAGSPILVHRCALRGVPVTVYVVLAVVSSTFGSSLIAARFGLLVESLLGVVGGRVLPAIGENGQHGEGPGEASGQGQVQNPLKLGFLALRGYAMAGDSTFATGQRQACQVANRPG